MVKPFSSSRLHRCSIMIVRSNITEIVWSPTNKLVEKWNTLNISYLKDKTLLNAHSIQATVYIRASEWLFSAENIRHYFPSPALPPHQMAPPMQHQCQYADQVRHLFQAKNMVNNLPFHGTRPIYSKATGNTWKHWKITIQLHKVGTSQCTPWTHFSSMLWFCLRQDWWEITIPRYVLKP